VWTPENYVRQIPLPWNIDGVVSPNDDGSFDIYLNSRHSEEHQLRWLEHELEHIRKDHFYQEKDIAAIEAEADGAAPTTADRAMSVSAKKPCFSSPEALIAYYREDAQRVQRDYSAK